VRLIVSSLTSPGLHLLARVERKWGESISADRSAERKWSVRGAAASSARRLVSVADSCNRFAARLVSVSASSSQSAIDEVICDARYATAPAFDEKLGGGYPKEKCIRN
jgi:hypothetical protein